MCVYARRVCLKSNLTFRNKEPKLGMLQTTRLVSLMCT